MTSAELKAALADIADAADAVVTSATAGEYTSIAAGEAAINDVRASIASALASVDTVWGVDGATVRLWLMTLAAALLDLRARLSDALATTTIVTDRPTSAVLVAVAQYGDFTRWTEIADLNPHVVDPSTIRAGTPLVIRVQ